MIDVILPQEIVKPKKTKKNGYFVSYKTKHGYFVSY